MRRFLLVTLTPLLLAGCLSPLTSRLDQANARAVLINDQLIIATSKLDEATMLLGRSGGKLDEANATFHRLEHRLDVMDSKFTVIELGFRKMLGIKGDGKDDE